MEHRKLPEYLLSSWRLHHSEEQQAKEGNELDGWTVSSLTEAFLQYQLNSYEAHQENQDADKLITPSLSSMIAGRILEELRGSQNLNADVQTISDRLNSTTLRQLMRDPRTPYPILRAFDALPQSSISGDAMNIAGRAVDIDEAVLRNERYIRSRGGINNDGKYLVGIKELVAILESESQSQTQNQTEALVFTRKDPPKGGLEILDEHRYWALRIQPNDDVYAKNFESITKGVLHGLDWTNVLVAGGMALTALTTVNGSINDESTRRNCEIDVYLYGLSPEQANRKVEEIYNVWNSNLDSGDCEKLVVKEAKSIRFLANDPQSRIQIVLKLLPSPTAVLLTFDLDPCAIGFNGSQVFMLPRCARALETGYSVFTMDLIWGDHLGDRRATQERRVLKYADRGFGLRILPSHAQYLEDVNLQRQFMSNIDGSIEEDVERKPLQSRTPERNRKPFGSKEPGLKTLKRVAYLGQDFVHRFFFGTTPLAIFPNRPSRSSHSDFLRDPVPPSGDGEYWTTSRAFWENEDDWKAEFARIEQRNLECRLKREHQQQAGDILQVPQIHLHHLNSRGMHYGQTDNRGLDNFELFMRHSEAWRLDACHEAELSRDIITDSDDDLLLVDGLATYPWSDTFDTARVAAHIEYSNDSLFESLKTAIVAKLGPPPIGHVDGGYRNYLTRRIRRQVYGPDIASVMKKQITIPMILPLDLENYILHSIPAHYADLPEHSTTSKSIIPVHDASKYDIQQNSRRSLQDTFDENGNLRYWVITNESMWAGQHRALDEIAELLCTFFHWFTRAVEPSVRPRWSSSTTIEPCIWHIARTFRRRIVLPEVLNDKFLKHRYSIASDATEPDLSSLRESMLFRSWVFRSPPCADKPHVRGIDSDGLDFDGPHDMFDEKVVLYPFPDELFWEQGDEGLWYADGVPPWREPAYLD